MKKWLKFENHCTKNANLYTKENNKPQNSEKPKIQEKRWLKSQLNFNSFVDKKAFCSDVTRATIGEYNHQVKKKLVALEMKCNENRESTAKGVILTGLH